MEKKIKILHVCTIIAIIIFCITQCWWLYTRYDYIWQNYNEELYQSILGIMQEDFENRRISGERNNIDFVTKSSIKVDNTKMQYTINLFFDVYVIDGSKYGDKDSTYSDRILNLYKKYKPEGIKKYEFSIRNCENEREAYVGLERFQVDEICPFSIKKLEDLLMKAGLKTTSITTEKVDSMVWKPKQFSHLNILKPNMTVIYPYDIFEGEVVRMNFDIGMSPIMKRMSGTMVLSLFISIMLISCLVFQIKTIRSQRKIEVLRKDFIQTMVHELKRPISTLKMCVSFMRNDILMADSQSRAEVISDSYNELDNLSSYFSKLRDLTFDDINEIPLNKSSFSLDEVINDCVKKLNIPGSKKIEIKIISERDIVLYADRMHITNIISNLLENAVKYSAENGLIKISYGQTKKGSVTISIKDNGCGISKYDQKFIFDKFYRSREVIDNHIPGMGLGLAYVDLLVKAHDGKVSVNSEEGKGAEFTITLPQNESIDEQH